MNRAVVTLTVGRGRKVNPPGHRSVSVSALTDEIVDNPMKAKAVPFTGGNMKMIRVLDKTGDTAIEFTEADAEATAKAKAVFDDWMKRRLPAFLTKRPDGKPDEKITSFDQIEEGAETVLVPGIVAG